MRLEEGKKKKMDRVQVGTIAHISGYVKKHTPIQSNVTEITEWKLNEPKEVLVLGKSKRYTGAIVGGWEEPNYLSIEKIHDVWIVMEIDKHNRYRKPMTVFESQIILELDQ